ncbi:MAG: hypothetical protein ABR502_06805 [Chitinophagaceae bacterium]
MSQMIEKCKYKWILLAASCIATPLIWAQEGNTGPEITGDNEDAWYTQPWIWIAGAVLLILLLIALLRNTKTSRSIVDKNRIDSAVADHSADP